LCGLGRGEEAAAVAVATGSDLLIGQLGGPAERAAAIARIARSLPAEMRAGFVTAGRLVTPQPRVS
jgi:hypothetical protein